VSGEQQAAMTVSDSADGPGLRDVLAYPPAILQPTPGGARVAVSYRDEWQDGFGARGWKLDVSLDDPEIIASTRETGERIPTSVLIHDLLDHLLSGFAMSGHRAEAMALAQLGLRTGSDVRSDYEQMVHEDLLVGRVQGEDLRSFLGETLLAGLSEEVPDDKTVVSILRERWGEAGLVERLIDRFYALGREGLEHAQHSWRRLGLSPQHRTPLGLALQQALVAADRHAQDADWSEAKGWIEVGRYECAITLSGRGMPSFEAAVA
jgi:hypothetical protein